LRLTFLGTGTSFGVPVVGCDCPTCTSVDPRDQRSRHGAVVETDDGCRVLIDAPPELRIQLLRAGIDRIDALWITHLHADHVHGLDDLRAFTVRRWESIDAHVASEYVEELQSRFRYIFDDRVQVPDGTTKPNLRLVPFDGDEIEICGTPFQPIQVPHPPVNAYGFRVGDLGYITDAKEVPRTAMETLSGVRVLVLNALWFGEVHPTHLIVEEAVEVADTIGAEMAYLTHLTHRVRHAELEERLPAHVRPSYDGLTIEL
jgi:phosphoribosyl 1,2-cyclic phosphate phosphodiesterase